MPDDRTLAVIQQLIALPTVSADGNANFVDFVLNYVASYPVRVNRFDHPSEPKANLLLSIGPENVPGLMLSGHSDVVPVDGQDWSADPFSPWVADGKLFGRGTCDMKGFLGLALAALPRMADAALKRPIHLAFSYDEEVGCAGVRSLVDHVAQLDVKPALCVVGEPTDMRIVTAHKGIRSINIKVQGLPAHSSDPKAGANAVVAAGRIIGLIDTMADALTKGPLDDRFSPPHTTMNVGQVIGGTAVNIVAEHASLDFEMRPIPAQDADALLHKLEQQIMAQVLPMLRATAPDSRIDISIISDAPALSALDDNPAERLLKRLLASNETQAVSFATEAGLFQHRAGIPTVVCGPGSINQAHKADEFVTLAQLDKAAEMIDQLIGWCCLPVSSSV